MTACGFLPSKQNNIATEQQVGEFCQAMDDLAANPDSIYVYSLIEVIGTK